MFVAHKRCYQLQYAHCLRNLDFSISTNLIIVNERYHSHDNTIIIVHWVLTATLSQLKSLSTSFDFMPHGVTVSYFSEVQQRKTERNSAITADVGSLGEAKQIELNVCPNSTVFFIHCRLEIMFMGIDDPSIHLWNRNRNRTNLLFLSNFIFIFELQ